MRYFDEIVGLRVYLALWVAVGHAVELSGFLKGHGDDGPLQLLINGRAAVSVFIIISGFVITQLLIAKHEPYPRYIIRRFFRLFPAFAVCCATGILAMPLWVGIVTGAPWQDAPGWLHYSASVVALRDAFVSHPLAHILAHATMIFGAIPNQILPLAPSTILPAAWSISLEWQFYLVAPLVLAGLLDRRWRFVVPVVAALAWAAYLKGAFGTFAIGSFLPVAVPYFAIGIASRLGYEKLSALDVSPVFVALLGAIGCMMLTSFALPLALWSIFYSYLLWGRNAPLSGALFDRLTRAPSVKLLGEASYSLYLVHRPIQIALGAVALALFSLSREAMLAVQFLAILIALPISVLLYFLIERRGMAFGRIVANLWPGPGAKAAPEPPTVTL